MIFHADYETLYQHVDKQILPKEYGGNAGVFSNQESSAAVYEMLEFFIQVKKYVTQNSWYNKHNDYIYYIKDMISLISNALSEVLSLVLLLV